MNMFKTLAVTVLLALSACAPAEAPPVEPIPVPVGTPPGATGGMCGGIAGFQCKAAGDYCAMPDGQCRMPDAAGTCQPKPQFCTREYRPVCGCDGKTYGNPCEAKAAGASIAHEGQCAPPAGDPALTADGWGPLRIGMTRAEITAALGPDANPNAVGGADPAQCDQYRPTGAPEGMLLMVEGGRLTRISLTRDSTVKTDRGLGLGATPAEVRAAYGADVKAEPHKYEDAPAQYLTVWSSKDRGVRYEVNGSGKVSAIHAGGPSIQYVEDCS